MCGGELANTVKVIACRDCAWKIFPEIASKTLTWGQIEVLLNDGKTPVLKGFKSKEGKAFEASLKLNHEAKAEFVFKKR
jgi:DNA topoisomerase-3